MRLLVNKSSILVLSNWQLNFVVYWLYGVPYSLSSRSMASPTTLHVQISVTLVVDSCIAEESWPYVLKFSDKRGPSSEKHHIQLILGVYMAFATIKFVRKQILGRVEV